MVLTQKDIRTILDAFDLLAHLVIDACEANHVAPIPWQAQKLLADCFAVAWKLEGKVGAVEEGEPD